MVDKKTLKLLCESCEWNKKCPVKKKAIYCDDYNNYKERLIVKEGSVKMKDNYILSIKGNEIQIIKPDRTAYEIVYQKVIGKSIFLFSRKFLTNTPWGYIIRTERT